MDIFNLLLITILVLILTYWYFTRNFNYWTNQNVPSAPNPIIGFGHVLPVITLKEHVSSLITKLYKSTNASVIGFHFLQRPALIVRDPELVKSVLLTNFSSFSSNFLQLNEKADPILTKNPFFTRDVSKWKEARARALNQLSGKKLSYLFVIIQQVCGQLGAYAERKINETGGTLECELKDFFSRYTGEIVANAAFAIEGQSFEDNPDRFAFTIISKTLFQPTLLNGLKQSVIFYLPSIGNLFQFKFSTTRAENYFKENLSAVIKQRKQADIAPNDFLQFILDANPETDIESIVSDAITFFTDVYETSSATLAAVFYHLSKNKSVQDKLRDDIFSSLEATDGSVTYESLKNMNYLEQVIFESMRFSPALGSLMKLCTNDITLEGSDGLKCHVPAGTPVFVPIMALHRDAQHWPNPEEFDPDRFNPENHSSHNKFTFLPFGEGPRMCLGMRLGLMVVKLGTIALLTKYSVEPSATTKLPLELNPESFLMYIKGGLWARFVKSDKCRKSK